MTNQAADVRRLFFWSILVFAWTVKSYSVQVTPVRTADDWYSLADIRYNEWIQGIGDTSRAAFRQATVEIYQEERIGSNLFLAKLNNEVVGAAEISPHELDNNVIHSESITAMYITDVVTDQKYRRKGIGQRLIRALEEKAAENGSNYILLHVAPENVSAIEFYKRLGFAQPCVNLSWILDDRRLADNAGTHGQMLLCKKIST